MNDVERDNYKLEKSIKKMDKLTRHTDKYKKYNKKKKAYHSKQYKPLDMVEEYKAPSDVKVWLDEVTIRMEASDLSKYPGMILRNQAIFCMAYLTGARVGEYSQIKMRDIRIVRTHRGEFMNIKLPNLKNPDKHIKHTLIALHNEEPFVKYIIKYYKFRMNELGIKLNPKYIINRIKYYAILDESKKNKLKSVIKKIGDEPFFRSYKSVNSISQIYKPLGLRGFNYAFIKFFDCNPHFIRHLRATMLLNVYGFDEIGRAHV